MSLRARLGGTIAVPRLRLAAARAAIGWERLWPIAWPPLGMLGLFLTLALSDMLPALPGLAHALILAALLFGFLWFALRVVRRFRWPSEEAARRRLELASGLSHRPLETLQDRLPTGIADPGAIALWRLHQRRVADQIQHLKVGRPRAGLLGVDPIALRAPLLIGLGLALIAAWGDMGPRLARAVLPELTLIGPVKPSTLVLWVTPPAYTGLAPLTFDPSAVAEQPIAIPFGSTLLAQVEGGRKIPVLDSGGDEQPFTQTGERIYRLETRITAGDRLAVRQGRGVLGEWPVRIVADALPQISFVEEPKATVRGTLKLAYRASDDYGIAEARLEIERADGVFGLDGKRTLSLELPLPALNPRALEAISYQDLTPHPWAGLSVKLRLLAKDAADQTGTGTWIEITLPERPFQNPAARAIIAERKRLVTDPANRLPVVRALGAINSRHELFQSDPVAILAIRMAQHRLIDDRSDRAVKEVVALLWDTALGIEEGETAIAERDLRAAQEALQEALARDAPDEEIERLMDELERALERYLEAMAEQLREQMRNGAEMRPMSPDQQMIRPEELKDLLDQAREMARSGAREAAKDLLAQLQEMLENLQAGMMAQQSDGTDQAMQMMNELDELMRTQQHLLDRSFRRAQQGEQPGEPGEMAEGQQQENAVDSAAQEALRRRLGDLMRQLGEMSGSIPRPMGEAERSMKGAVQSLDEGQPGAAADAQSNALDALQRSARAMAEQFQRQFGRMPGQGEQGLDRFGNRRDPFGRTRPQGRFEDTGDVQIPDKSDVQRAREILDELRRRAGERTRPAPERDYIDRLLRRF
ncbi:MAG TPA: TIGR02302 family protein [Alphaproteobacteria bacterium]|nr:TIGR02302 family protein [Alphaproteobacteria bacterium]